MPVLKRLRAFTLIELLIVITIIGILAVALVPKIIGAPEKARDAQRKADLQQIATALELYQDDNGGDYPTTTSFCVSDLDFSGYLTTTPDDPQGNKTGDCGDGYEYQATSDGYILGATLESANASGDGIYEAFTITDTATTAANFPSTKSTCSATSTCTNPTLYVFR